MVSLKYFIVFVFFTIDPSEERSIVVAVPRSDPFFVHQNSSQNGLDIKIIETFAKKIKHSVEYMVINGTLSEVFATEDAIKPIFQQS